MSKVATLMRIAKITLRSASIPKFAETTHGEYQIRAFKRSEWYELTRSYAMAAGTEMPLFNRLVLYLCGGRLCVVAVNKNNWPVGFDHFYFNDHDLRDSTVHEGYVAVVPAHERQGLASALRRHSIEHFRRAGLVGITTRISHDNAGSMISAKKCGFETVEDYIDLDTNEMRSFMIARLV